MLCVIQIMIKINSSNIIMGKIDWKIEKVKLFLSIPIVFMDHYEKSNIFHNAIKIDRA